MPLNFMDCEQGGPGRSPSEEGASGGPSCAHQQNSRMSSTASPISLFTRTLASVTKTAVHMVGIGRVEDTRDTR